MLSITLRGVMSRVTIIVTVAIVLALNIGSIVARLIDTARTIPTHGTTPTITQVPVIGALHCPMPRGFLSVSTMAMTVAALTSVMVTVAGFVWATLPIISIPGILRVVISASMPIPKHRVPIPDM